MKILHTVCDYAPHLSGNQQIVQGLSERLVRRGHKVTVLTAYNPQRNFGHLNGVEILSLKIRGNGAVGMRGEKEAYQRILLSGDYDLIMNYGTNVWTTDLAFNLLPEINAPKVLIPVGFTPLASIMWRAIYLRYYRDLPGFMAKYDKVVYNSTADHKPNLDKNFGDKHGITNYVVIPNAVSEEDFVRPLAQPNGFRAKFDIRTPHILLSVGHHQWLKGHRFMIRAIKQLARSDTSLIIVGDEVSNSLPTHSCYNYCAGQARSSGGAIRVLTHLPRSDTVAAFRDADLYLLGSHFECSPVVLLEAMASRTPFVATDVGNARQLRGGLTVTDPFQMAQMVGRLLDNPSERARLSETGYEEWRSKYTWERVVRLYEGLYRDLVQRA
jgi:glycosyltransferase involved in cell wall biosynthesis